MELEVKNYTKELGNQVVLNSINMKFESGNIYGLHGRNGSGKTMLFRAISHLIHPTDGDILVDGKSIVNDEYDIRNIGLLIENPDFYPYLSGIENLKLLYEINHKKDDHHIEEVLKLVGLENAMNKKYKAYSLGMKKRLMLAQAIMEDQSIILLDEPTNGLDEKGVQDLREILKQEREKGKLIIIASHNKEDLQILADHIYQIDQGKILGEINL